MRVWLPAIRTGAGADVFTLRLSRLLVSHGVDATLTWFPRWGEFAPDLLPIRVPSGVQVIQGNSWNAFAFAKGPQPLVVTVHHSVHDPSLAPYKTAGQRLYHRWHVRPLERRSFKKAAAITAVSDYTRLCVERAFGYRGIRVIPNWVDTDIFHPGARPQERHTPFRLLFVGNWSRRKGADVLLPLMQRLGPEFELLFTMGLRGTAPSRRLPDNVRWAGLVHDERGMAELYRQCDALIVPSRLEGFGYAALEAMACGKPVIAFNTSSLPEVVQDGTTGLLVPLDDLGALAGACLRLAEDGLLRKRMGEAAQERAVTRFSSTAAISAYRAVYQAVR